MRDQQLEAVLLAFTFSIVYPVGSAVAFGVGVGVELATGFGAS